ncbi:MAG: 2-amino-4-hydroxy-6-hydroxymethyldihydropteridine diphosphokinase [Treponema sp.]|jgi:2-amino-4-hydroxy-6-hydroxymethyldihydropteridine diphosphokinase|nr:2-amino-4-hydroxy-6-hydroxymethyldihydropteridine diphosphokinase [Treponema sp.]
MEIVVLGLGSNMMLMQKNGFSVSSEDILSQACVALCGLLKNVRFSSIYKTKPRYVENQADFYNMVVSGEWYGTPQNLLLAVQKIENDFGRERAKACLKGPRTLDIDIELFGNQIIKDENKNNPLFIPHPLLNERQFVLVPLLEILPDSADPITGQPFRQILSMLSDQGVELWKRYKNLKV